MHQNSEFTRAGTSNDNEAIINIFWRICCADILSFDVRMENTELPNMQESIKDAKIIPNGKLFDDPSFLEVRRGVHRKTKLYLETKLAIKKYRAAWGIKYLHRRFKTRRNDAYV